MTHSHEIALIILLRLNQTLALLIVLLEWWSSLLGLLLGWSLVVAYRSLAISPHSIRLRPQLTVLALLGRSLGLLAAGGRSTSTTLVTAEGVHDLVPRMAPVVAGARNGVVIGLCRDLVPVDLEKSAGA